MTQASGQLQRHKQDLPTYLDAWARMMITIWQEKMIMMNVNDTWELYNSLKSNINIHSGGEGAMINFSFNEYGIYVNAGTGKEVFRGNPGDIMRESKKREVKPWFDKGFYRSVRALREAVARIYGEAAAGNIIFYLNQTRV